MIKLESPSTLLQSKLYWPSNVQLILRGSMQVPFPEFSVNLGSAQAGKARKAQKPRGSAFKHTHTYIH